MRRFFKYIYIFYILETSSSDDSSVNEKLLRGSGNEPEIERLETILDNDQGWVGIRGVTHTLRNFSQLRIFMCAVAGT